MAQSDAAAVLRADIQTLVLEAAQVDQMFIGLQCMPEWGVQEKSGQWPKFRLGKGELLNDDATRRTPQGSYNLVNRTYENDNYTVEDFGLAERVDDSYKNDVARFFDAEAQAALQIRRQVQIGHESLVAAAMMNASTFNATAAAVAYTEGNIATIDLVRDVSGCVSRLNDKGVIPNTIVMSKNVFLRVRRSTLLLNFLRGVLGNDATRLATAAQIAQIFADDGITRCLVGKMPKNSAKKGAAFSSAQVWGDTYIWVGYCAGGDPMAGGCGRTVVWTKDGPLFTTESWYDTDKRSNMVRVRHSITAKTVDATSGELITTSYS